MRFRAGLVVGFATGFYAGAMAGRERYEQINGALRRVRRSEAIDAATGKAKAVVDLGVERARDIVETTFSRDPAMEGTAPAEADRLTRTPGEGNGDSPR